MCPDADTDREDRLAEAIGGALQYAANEAIVLARLEEFLSPKPAQLAADGNAVKSLNDLADRVTALYGDAPRLIIQGTNDPKPVFDTYLSAAIDEAIEVFKRARRSLCRAQAFLIGTHMLRTDPDILGIPKGGEAHQVFLRTAESVFWEHTETTYIRLAGFWDRVGQILDFAFFTIRQYERDGFSAVVDRIRANALRMQPQLEKSAAWHDIWAYKKSEREDGLQWLLSRRNLLVHSLHLRPLDESKDEELFESAFNHIDARLRSNLAPNEPEKEIEQLHLHLAQAAKLLPQVLTLCELRAKT
ncbi:hypothetical protein azo3074 [Azoarcus olearius]|uniref:Uncharacterized protein n=1 Tax=Azoarcus sp. (strain BH72) TaxID=418699 RepID=A1KA35_AZOSB|nr:hypothetical protein azo3074 [Azoarcus olearius]